MKPTRLKRGDKVAIVSLSSGILGEPFIKYELDLGVKRMEEFGLIPVFMNNSLKGLDFIKNHPEARADDLKQAFADPEIKAIFCAIGGTDSYLTLPYLLNDETFKQCVKSNPKIFMGFSDSTTTHLMLNKLGLTTFYGQAFLVDIAEFEPDMLPYSKEAFMYLFNPESNHKINPSKFWYKNRTDYSPAAVGTMREKFEDKKGYELLQGSGKVQGKLLGGCIEVLAEYIDAGLVENQNEINKIITNCNPFPTNEEWKDAILLIETSDGLTKPEDYRKIIKQLKSVGVMNQINGIVVGKPMDEVYYEEYKQILKEELAIFNFPILYNINIGHSYPHTILPLGEVIEIDAESKTLTIKNNPLN